MLTALRHLNKAVEGVFRASSSADIAYLLDTWPIRWWSIGSPNGGRWRAHRPAFDDALAAARFSQGQAVAIVLSRRLPVNPFPHTCLRAVPPTTDGEQAVAKGISIWVAANGSALWRLSLRPVPALPMNQQPDWPLSARFTPSSQI